MVLILLYLMDIKIGVIGGSGLDDPNLLTDFQEIEVETPYGLPSSTLTSGKLNGVEVVILARHGKNHEIPPSLVNYRANIYALKEIGCTHIIATSAVGSLKEEIKPGDLVFPDQFIDMTRIRKNSFYDRVGEVVHIGMAEPFSKELRDLMIKQSESLGFEHHKRATIVVIEGPRFSTRAESYMYRNFADIIGMTTFPEAALAKELGVPYASVAMSTDYDCWKDDEEPVTFEMVMETMRNNAEKVKKLLLNVIPRISNHDVEIIRSRIRTIPDFPKPGIQFRDITTLLADPVGMKKVVEIFLERYKNMEIDAVAGIESRGFIIGSILADKLGVGFIPIRKPGKLPFETISEEYDLEYGTDKVEIHRDAVGPGDKVLVVDDLIATGGTCKAACILLERLGAEIVECAFVIGLPDLKGKEKLHRWNSFSIVDFEGE